MSIVYKATGYKKPKTWPKKNQKKLFTLTEQALEQLTRIIFPMQLAKQNIAIIACLLHQQKKLKQVSPQLVSIIPSLNS